MTRLLADLRSGIRMLVRYPTLSGISILTLGLGIGMSTTVFCVVNGGLFKGLPIEGGDRIVAIFGTNPAQNLQQQPVNAQDLLVIRERQTSFERIGAFGFMPINLAAEGERPERFRAGQFTVEAFEALGVPPILGRGFRAGDDRPGAAPIILLGYDVWQRRFGGAPDIAGQTVRTDGVTRTIIGVMPADFGFPARESLWVPLEVAPVPPPRAQAPAYPVVGRLKPGVSVAQADAQIAEIATQLAAEHPATNRGISATVVPYAVAGMGREIFALLYTMLGAGIGVLLIACVNVSNLLLARASLRRREVVVRMALGAGSARVIRQQITEVLVLAVAGGAIGVMMSVFGMRWFTRALEVNPPPFWIRFDLDFRVMLFVLALIVLASLFAGGLPALQSARLDAAGALKDDSRSSTSVRLGRFSGALVVAELAVSCGLLIAAGLMIKSVVQLRTVDMPFAVDSVLTARLDLPRSRYADSAASIRFYDELLPRLQALPGVVAATMSDGLPAAGNGLVALVIEGKSYPHESDYPLLREGIVTAGYFATFETPIRGREFTPADTATSQPVAIINESFARAHYPGVDPIGRTFKRIRPNREEPWLTVVGVVPDLMMQGIGNNNASPDGYYIPISQSDVANAVRIALRAQGDPTAATPFLRSAVASLDPDLAVYDVQPLRRVIDQQTWFYNVFGTFFMAFGFCALFLAAAGLYGVMSFAVTQRSREMGVRSALGARGNQLISLVMRRSLIQLAIGLVFGLGLALLASGALQPVLYQVDPRDPRVFLSVIAVLTVAALAATYLPARRVTRIDPVIALTIE